MQIANCGARVSVNVWGVACFESYKVRDLGTAGSFLICFESSSGIVGCNKSQLDVTFQKADVPSLYIHWVRNTIRRVKVPGLCNCARPHILGDCEESLKFPPNFKQTSLWDTCKCVPLLTHNSYVYITYTYNIMRRDIRGFRSRVAEDLNFLVNCLTMNMTALQYFETSQTTWPKTRCHVPEDVNVQFRAFLPSVFRQLYLHVKIYRTQYTKLGRPQSRTKFYTEENNSTLVGNTKSVTIPSSPSWMRYLG